MGPSIFAMALETLAIKAFGDMGQTARLRIIRDRFVAGHDSCELHQHLDSVPLETPIQDIIDRCRVWESHADSDVRRYSKLGPNRALPIYTMNDSGCRKDDQTVAAVTTSQSTLHQLETLLRRLLPGLVVPPPPLKPVPSALEQLLQRLLAQKPAPAATTGSSDIESLLQSLLPGNLASATRLRPGPMRRDWATVVCFSCGKAGHSATQCPDLNEAFLFMLPGWKAEKVGGGYVLISPRVAAEHHWAGNGD